MTLSAGIIGTGGIAGMGILGMHEPDEIGTKKIEASHAGGYNATDGIELQAIADIDAAKLERFGEAWDIPPARRYEDHREMLAAESLDVVSVCTPSSLHGTHVVDVAKSPNPPSVIWCEKPIASSIKDASRMIDICEGAGVELVVNHSFRFTEKLERLRELIVQDNLLGEIHAVSTQFRMELLRNSTHLLDTLVYLLDSRAARVSGYVTGENEAVDSLDIDRPIDDAGGGGYVITDDNTFITVDCTIPRNDSSMMLTLVGTEGKLYMNNDDGEWRYWSLEDGKHIERPLPGIEGAWTWEDDYREAFPAATKHIVELFEDGVENRSPGVDAARSLEIIIGFYLSHYTGGHVSIPLERPLAGVEITSW